MYSFQIASPSTLILVMMCVRVDAQLSTFENWPNPIAHDVMPYHTSGLTHGPHLGCPTSNSVRVWLRTETPQEFRLVYSKSFPLDPETATAVEGKTTDSDDPVTFVELTELEPNTRYFYGITTTNGLIDTRVEFDRPWPSFKTLPSKESFPDKLNNPDGLFNFSFSLSSCQRQKSPVEPEKFGIYGNPPAYNTLWKNHGRDVAFHIVNGDFTYEEVLDGTLAGYANNYQLYFSRGRNMSNFFRYVPFIAMYNDHEVNSNLDGAGEVGRRDGNYLKRDPALSVWNKYIQWSNDNSPHRSAIRFGQGEAKQGEDILFDPAADFSSLDPNRVSTIHIGPYIQGDQRSKADRGAANVGVYGLTEVIDQHRLRVTPKFRASNTFPYSIGTHHYFDRKVGNCHFFFLDTRGERSKFPGTTKTRDPKSFILGETQREWFLNGMKNSDADFLFVISPDPWTIYHSGYHVKPENGTGSKGDGFCGYVHERELMLPELDAIAKPVLIFTGDVHNSFAIQVTDNIWEFMCGPMNSAGHPIGTAGLPPFGGWFDSEGRTVKIKWVAGFPDNVHYSRQRNTYYAVVKVNNIMQAARLEGSGLQFIPYDEPQVVVQFFDGYTGKLQYAEGISTLDSKTSRQVAPKISRWPNKSE